jgi:hypothetical protein
MDNVSEKKKSQSSSGYFSKYKVDSPPGKNQKDQKEHYPVF